MFTIKTHPVWPTYWQLWGPSGYEDGHQRVYYTGPLFGAIECKVRYELEMAGM